MNRAIATDTDVIAAAREYARTREYVAKISRNDRRDHLADFDELLAAEDRLLRSVKAYECTEAKNFATAVTAIPGRSDMQAGQ